MKKILSLLLVLALLLGLTGCFPFHLPEVSTEPTQTIAAVTETAEATEPSTEVTVPESEPEPTQAPTEKPEPKPTQPQPDEPEDTRPRPTETQDPHPQETTPEETEPAETAPAPQKSYTGKEEVAAYLAKHGRLPDNFITKSEAKSYGWKSGRRLEDYAPGMCIGGDRFYNKEGLLPAGKIYYECDIDTLGVKNRGAKRIVFSSDGDIYYTDDHYSSFYRYLGPNQWERI